MTRQSECKIAHLPCHSEQVVLFTWQKWFWMYDWWKKKNWMNYFKDFFEISLEDLRLKQFWQTILNKNWEQASGNLLVEAQFSGARSQRRSFQVFWQEVLPATLFVKRLNAINFLEFFQFFRAAKICYIAYKWTPLQMSYQQLFSFF